MKKRLVTFIFLSVFCLSGYAKKSEQPLDQMIAIVNDDVITKSELNRALAMVKMQAIQEHLATPKEKELQKQVLDQLINKKLELQIAKQIGIKISNSDLDKTIEQIAKQNNLSTKELYQRIQQEGMSISDYRNEMREQITLQKLQQEEIIKRITVTPQEITRFLNKQPTQNNASVSKEYHLEDVLIPLPDAPSSKEIAEAQKRAQDIIAKLNTGQTLAQITKTPSSPQDPVKTNDLGWRKLSEIPSLFVEPLNHIKVKETTAPIKAANGFHVLRLVEERSLHSPQVSKTRQEAETLLLQQKFEEAMKPWIAKLRSQAFIVTK